MSREREVRAIGAPRKRALTNAEKEAGYIGAITGKIPYNSDSELLTKRGRSKPFIERIAPGAFDRSLREDRDIMVNAGHTDDPLAAIGRIGENLTVTSSADELTWEALVPDTRAGKDLLSLVDKGIIRGTSFEFEVRDQTGEHFSPRDSVTDTRTIRTARLIAFNPVTWPAYPSSSLTVDMRRAATVSSTASTTIQPGNIMSKTATLRDLQERRGALLKRASNIQERATVAARDLTEDERLTREEIIQSARYLDVQIEDAEHEMRRSRSQARFHDGRSGHSDMDRYSLVRALHLAASGHFDGLEAEVSQEEARAAGRTPEGIFIPLTALAGPNVERRDLTATGGSSGSEGGATFTPRTGSFIDALRPRLALARLGATILGGLTADVKLPRQAAASTASWKTENGTLDEKSPTFDQVSLTARRVGAFTEISKQLLVQSSLDVENLVRMDLLAAIAIAIDQAGIAGTGVAPEPLGILNTSGIGDVALGANGGAPIWTALTELLADLAAANADGGTISFLSNPLVRKKLQDTIYDAGSGLNLLDKAGSLGPWAWSNNVPSDLDKGTSEGVCSAIIAGDFSQAVIGQFGTAADIVVDPYTKATEGLTRVVIQTFADVAIRRAAYFSAIQDALTS